MKRKSTGSQVGACNSRRMGTDAIATSRICTVTTVAGALVRPPTQTTQVAPVRSFGCTCTAAPIMTTINKIPIGAIQRGNLPRTNCDAETIPKGNPL